MVVITESSGPLCGIAMGRASLAHESLKQAWIYKKNKQKGGLGRHLHC